MTKIDRKIETKSKLFHDIAIRVVKLANIIAMTIPFAIAWYSSYADLLWVKFSMRGHWLVIALFVIVYCIIGKIYDAFRMSYYSKVQMAYSQILSLFEVNIVMYIVAWLLIRYIPRALPLLIAFGCQIIIAILWSRLSQNWYFYTFPAFRTVVIWDRRKGISGLIDEYNLNIKYKVVSEVFVEDCIADLSILNGADTVFMIGINSHDRDIIANYCVMHDIKSFIVPNVGDLIMAGAKRSHMFHLLVLKVERFNPSLEYMVAKRIGDIFLSILAVILFSPIMVIAAICIKLEDGGPVIYKQCRLTKDGKEFDIYKFRSMRTDAEKDGIARLSTGDNDDRMTKVGRIIRKYRIDEMPQLFNILKGDLSIVGPRAERPEIAREYQKELPEFELRLQAKAGLTGYAQVYGKYNTTPYDKLLMDLMYLAKASVWEDLRIIFATVKILFLQESTEGIEEGKTTAMGDR